MIRNLFSSTNQIKLGAILSYSTIIVTSIIGIGLTPFIIRSLGNSEYGLYILIGSFVGYITILDLGLNHTIVRFVSKYRAVNDKNGEERFLATVLLIYMVIAFLVVAIGFIFYMNLNFVFSKSLTAEELHKAKIMFAILIFNLAIAMPGVSFDAICNGYERFVIPRAVNIIKYIVRSAMLVGILLMGGKAISIVVLDTLMNISSIAVNAYYVIYRLNVKLNFHKIDISLLKEIFSYSVWIFIFAIVAQFQWQTGQVVLGILSGTKLVAIFGVGVMLGTYYGGFATAISGLFLPRASKMIADFSSSEELTTMMIKVGRVALIVLMYILGAFILYGRDFIHLWVGDNYYESWFVALLIMFGYTIPLVQSFANSILEARALLSFKVLLYLGTTLVGTLFGALLVNDFGVRGMICGSVSFWIISQIVLNIYLYKVLKLNVIRFFKELINNMLISFLFIMVISIIAAFHSKISWGYFILNISIYSIVYVAIMFRFGMNTFEKDLVLVNFKRK